MCSHQGKKVYVDQVFTHTNKRQQTPLQIPFVCMEELTSKNLTPGIDGVISLGVLGSRLNSNSTQVAHSLIDSIVTPNLTTAFCRNPLGDFSTSINPLLRVMFFGQTDKNGPLADKNKFSYWLPTNKYPSKVSRLKLGQQTIFSNSSVNTLEFVIGLSTSGIQAADSLVLQFINQLRRVCSSSQQQSRCVPDPSEESCVCLSRDNHSEFLSAYPSFSVDFGEQVITIPSKVFLKERTNSPDCLCLDVRSTNQSSVLEVGVGLLSLHSWLFVNQTWIGIDAGCERELISPDVIRISDSDAGLIWYAVAFVGLVLLILVVFVCWQLTTGVRRDLPRVQVGSSEDQDDTEPSEDPSAAEHLEMSKLSISIPQANTESSKPGITNKRRVLSPKRLNIKLA